MNDEVKVYITVVIITVMASSPLILEWIFKKGGITWLKELAWAFVECCAGLIVGMYLRVKERASAIFSA